MKWEKKQIQLLIDKTKLFKPNKFWIFTEPSDLLNVGFI